VANRTALIQTRPTTSGNLEWTVDKKGKYRRGRFRAKDLNNRHLVVLFGGWPRKKTKPKEENCIIGSSLLQTQKSWGVDQPETRPRRIYSKLKEGHKSLTGKRDAIF